MDHRLDLDGDRDLRVMWLDDGELAADAAGKKAHVLSVLVAHHVDVPLGFVVPIDAFNFWERTGKLNRSTLGAIASAYDRLIKRAGNAAVAVRSSATDEDSVTSSYAGQYVTHLNIVGTDSVIDAVTDCWRSYRSRRIQEYRTARGLVASGGMAIIVQEMMRPRAAGVLFTKHPVDHRPLYVIEAAAGIGLAIVDGSTIPERVVVNPSTLDIVEHTRPDSMHILTAADIANLVRCGNNLERICGDSLDIEWSITRHVQVLQARPITV